MRRLGSILLLVILTVVFPALLLVTSVRSNLLTPKFLKRELAGRNVYGLAVSQIDAQIAKINIDPQYPITRAEIADLAHDVVSEAWLRQNVENVTDRFAAWLKTPSGTPLTLTVDLREPKAQLAAGVDAFLTAKLPQIKPCPNRRQSQSEQGICQFAGLTVAQVKEQLGHMGLNPDMIQTLLPDTLDLLNPDLSKITGQPKPADQNSAAAKSREITANLERAKEIYQRAQRYWLYAWIGWSVLALGALALNATKGWRRLTRWFGILGLSVGMLPLAMAIASRPVVEQTLLMKLRLDPAWPAELQALVPQLILDVRQAVFGLLLIVGIVLVSMGLVALVGTKWIPKPKEK